MTDPNKVELALITSGLGLTVEDAVDWIARAESCVDGIDLTADSSRLNLVATSGKELLARISVKGSRSPEVQAGVDALLARLRAVKTQFMRFHADKIYRELTDDLQRFVRVEDLINLGADRFPGLLPSRSELASERELLQKQKDGLEIDQGIFISQILSQRECGLHLVHAMLRPREDSLGLLAQFRRNGSIDFGVVKVERVERSGVITVQNTRFLNAEDDSTIGPIENAIDLVLLDPEIEVGVLRGGVVDHRKYAGRRVFSAGINLTHLYHGKISFVDFYLVRDLGLVNKLFRGLSGDLFAPNEPESTIEKPWIAAVDAFAIGGGCQILLAVDRVIAERGAFFNLPARKEGIIPGVAPLRLPRFVGDKLTLQAILYERGFAADSAEGSLICDEVVESDQMDVAVQRTVDGLTSSGAVSAAANRRALRVGTEPRDLFRQYMATYAIEQAYCHLSDALIRNLELNWGADQREL